MTEEESKRIKYEDKRTIDADAEFTAEESDLYKMEQYQRASDLVAFGMTQQPTYMLLQYIEQDPDDMLTAILETELECREDIQEATVYLESLVDIENAKIDNAELKRQRKRKETL